MIRDQPIGPDDPRIGETVDFIANHGPNDKRSSDTTADRQGQPSAENDQTASVVRDRLPWQEAASIVARLADTVDRLHAESKIHGQISPHAITFGPDGEPCLAATDSAMPSSRSWEKNDHMTVGVAAPECIDNTGRSIDHRTDVYGLGIVLYHMLCGREPFRSQDVGELRRQVMRDAPQPPRQLVHGVPREVESACLRAVSKDPAERFQSAAHLAAALRTALEQDESLSGSGVYLSGLQALGEASRQDFVIVEFTLVGDSVCDSSDRAGDVRGVLESRLGDLAVDCMQDITVEQVDWTANGLLFQVEAGTPGEVTEAAIGAGLRLVNRITELFAGTEFTLTVGTRIVVRLQVAEISDQSAGGFSSAHGRVRRDDLQRRGTRLEATVQHDRIELTRRSIETVGRWYACTAGNSRDVWTVGGGDIPALDVHVQESAERPFQGRSTQLAMLRDRWMQACEGMGQIVLIIGEEGMGKTRLVSELGRFTQQSATDNVLTVQWNCLPKNNCDSLQPAATWFRRLLRLDESVDMAECRRRLSEHLRQHHVDSMEVTDALADLVGAVRESGLPAGLTQTQRKQRILSALLHWLKALTQHSPVLFIVEDLQWLDPTTLELLNQLLEQGLNDRLLTIFTLRPEFDTPWGSRAHQTQITLNRFSKRDLAAVLASLRSTPTTVADATLESAMAETRGVPLAVEEFARQLEPSVKAAAYCDKGKTEA
jgi:hypothetical protein